MKALEQGVVRLEFYSFQSTCTYSFDPHKISMKHSRFVVILEKKRASKVNPWGMQCCCKKDKRNIHLTTTSPTDKRNLESLYV